MALPPLATWGCLTTFVIALVGAIPNNVDTVPAEVLMELGTHRHLQALMSNMTAKEALARPPSMPAELQAFVRQQLGDGTERSDSQAFLQASTSKSKKMGAATSLQLDLGTMDAEKARVVLNKMAMDTMSKLDIQRAECLSQKAKQGQLVDETGQDVSSFNTQGTTARAQVMATESAIKRLEELVPQLNHELTVHEAKCKDSHASLRKEIGLIKKDAKTLTEVTGMASCSSLLQTGVLHCQKQRKGRKHSFIAFRHHALRHKAAQLRSPTTRRALQTALLEVTTSRHRRHGHRGGRRHQRSHQRVHRHRQHHRGTHRRHSRKHGHQHVAFMEQRSRSHTKVWPTKKAHMKSRCQVAENPDCNMLRDKLMFMQAGVVDDVDDHLAQLASSQEDCKAAKESLQSQIQSSTMRLQEQQEMLAEATAIMTDAAEQTRLKGRQMDHLEAETAKMNAFCQDTLNQAALSLCKIKSIRQELYKMASKAPFIQDCEVSAWTPEECSVPCGGGVHNLVRQVIVPDDKGAACPPLSMQQSCNTQECPVNCDMGEWSGWTSCSAKCGGGIKQRIRRVKQQAQHGGKLCGAETDSLSCGMEPCDKDCALAVWTRWGGCSKACGGGFKERTRKVLSPASGLGRCFAEDSKYRLQYKKCHTTNSTNATCQPKDEKTKILKCAAKVDIVILIDGSGSLGKKGWDTMQEASKLLVKAMDPKANDGNGAQVAALLYSGPKNMRAFKKCTGQSKKTVDLASDCKMQWVSHLTDKVDKLALDMGDLVWQKGSTMTSQALASAEAELLNGRPDTPQVVIALVDKMPMMPRKTGEAAASLRKKARLIFAAATGPAELPKFASWASRPVADNFVYMHKVEDFSKPETLNKIIASACPKVE